MSGEMKYSKDGLALTESFEGFRDIAYQDSVGVWTIGFGHTKGVKSGMTCDKPQADAWVLEDVADAEAAVNRLVHIAVTQDEFDALVDFTFNLGVGNFQHSTLLVKLNARDIDGAAGEFEKWDRAGGKVVAGLLRRRQAERVLFQRRAGMSGVTWQGTLGVIEKLAPTIACAAGGPLIGGAVTALEGVFGLKPAASMDDRKQAIADAISNATPEQLAAVQAKNQDFALGMATVGFKDTETLASFAVQDRTSARNMQVSTKSLMPPILGSAVIVASIAAAALILLGKVGYESTTQATMIGTVIGYLFSEAKAVLSFYFGSSQGSETKTQLMAAQAQQQGDQS